MQCTAANLVLGCDRMIVVASMPWLIRRSFKTFLALVCLPFMV
uniref:Uncharacterized protein n=1 Tax=Arundo donax TaxID=35708 RepID=A0A0A8ZQ81_ARUDO